MADELKNDSSGSPNVKISRSGSLAALPHRFHQFEVPTHSPYFDKADCRWPSIVGHFFMPIVRDPAVQAFVFLNHSPNNVELRFASAEYTRIEQEIEKLRISLDIRSKVSPVDGELVSKSAFCGPRWISPEKSGAAEVEQRRSELVFRFLHAGCELFIDNLVRDGDYWRIELNKDAENPLGNSFESLIHLISNFSEAEFDVFLYQTGPSVVSAATAWMQRPVPLGSVRCHL